MARQYKKKASQASFLEAYSPAESYLLKPAIAAGRPGLIEGVSPAGDPVLIRVWPRRTTEDQDLFDIWRHELRQLHRLGGYPGAQRFIAKISDAGSDTKGFYIVLDTGQRRPLEVILERGRAATDWLRALGLPGNRHRLWSNLRNVACGLEILHNEGLVHRNLDGWAVLTTAGANPDFQLTGFEWSLRLRGTTDTPKPGLGPALPSVSFSADWTAFAQLAARVLNISSERLSNPSIPDYDVHESATAAEIRLLRNLALPNELPRIDGELVSTQIDRLLGALDASRSSDDGRYHLALRLSGESDLSRAVRDASDLSIEVEDHDAQLAWIKADLGPNVALIATGDRDNLQIVARGRELVYRLRQYRGTNDEPTWQFAFCEQAEKTGSWRRPIVETTELPATAFNILPHQDARSTYQRVRGRVPSWAKLIESFQEAVKAETRESRLHRALALLHTVEIAFAAANTFPVNVRYPSSTSGDLLEIRFRSDRDAEEISDALDLDPPAERLKKALEDERTAEGEGWTLTEAANLGQARSGDLEVTYDGQDSSHTVFRFRRTGHNPLLFERGYLIQSGARGDFIQFRRRSRAIRLLKEHSELLQVMADPRGRLLPSHDEVREDEGYKELDVAKQIALKELVAVLPIYLLQGPPGVGKTFLIKDLVRRQFEDDRATRLLVTAQGNHALDHLLDELAGSWASDSEKPLTVRCRPKDDVTEAGVFDLYATTARLATSVAESPLALAASSTVRQRLIALSNDGSSSGDRKATADGRALEGLIMRASNLVFATTNSADLERLVEERGQFDWTIIEEAGKATGCEVVTPLMLSHRRLLIGDHKQLPPFGSRELQDILDDVKAVRRTLKSLPTLIDRNVRHLLDDELLEFMEDETQDIEGLCTDAKRVLFFFENALSTELQRRETRPGGRPIASTLTVQHRMHPTICKLVSGCFYGDLETSDRRKVEAAEQGKWLASRDPNSFPNLPLVWLNMPYQRSAHGVRRIEQYPRFTNRAEIEVALNVVRQLVVTAAASKKPSLVVLTPYARQVSALKDAILADSAARKVLEAFRPVARNNEWCSTVDAFQGNEADVVIFSLVRNNRGATLRSALGFVADPRRFNVLLSRARQRLVFIGSHEFLKTVAAPLGLEDNKESEFLRKFLSVFTDLADKQEAAILDSNQLLGGS